MPLTSKPRRYYSSRTGTNPKAAQLDLNTLKSLVLSGYTDLKAKGYFDEAFGSWCVDNDFVPGAAGSDVENYVLFNTRKNLWPIENHLPFYEEADLFDMIEFLFDHVSKPISGWVHNHAGCGMHWDKFDREAGQEEFRSAMSLLLESYDSGYELSDRGEIMGVGPAGLNKLLKAAPPTGDEDVLSRVNGAIDRFQRYGSSIEDRRHAVRDLADVLEKMRPLVKEALNTKDEADLFNLANNFAIRHFNEKQKGNYDRAVWLSWMFYFYLATINACLHIMKKKARASSAAISPTASQL